MTARFAWVALIAAAAPVPAWAQSAATAQVAVEATTDRRERGLSWSDGKPALAAFATVPVADRLAVDVDAVTLRGSRRHGGADVGLAVAPRYSVEQAGWTLGAGARGRVFVGESGLSYYEFTGSLERTIGPLRLAALVDFAPSQDAIGGRNLHVEGQALAGIPGLPFTLYGGVGRTSGSDSGDPRAQRLRPGGSYTDHHVGIEHASGPLAAGLRYSDTDIAARDLGPARRFVDGDYGARLVAYLRFTP